MSAQGAPSGVLTYGGWRRPGSAGLGKFTLAQTMALMGAAIGIVLVNVFAGMAWGVGLGALVALIAAPAVVKDKHGMSPYGRGVERMKFARLRRAGKNITRQGVLSPSPSASGECRLPGVLAGVELSEHTDSYQRPFGVLHHAHDRLSIVFAISPAGDTLVDPDMIDHQVAAWGMWLTDLSDESGLMDATVTVETVPDTGERLGREVRSRMSPQAPDLAAQIMEDVIAGAGAGGAVVNTWVCMSFDAAKLSTERKGRTDRAIHDIATRLPGLTQSLVSSGAGAVHVLSAREIAMLARVAYDPAVQSVIDKELSAGRTVEVDWAQCGPVSMDLRWDHMRHDSGLSTSWVMTRPPRGVVHSGVLRRLLAVSRDVERKRVTILYRPMDSAKAPDVVERDVDKARGKLSMSKPSERVLRDIAQAQQTAREEADGASILDFGLIITATMTGPKAAEQLADTTAAVASLSAASRLSVRPAYGAQDAAFALGLPLGVAPRHQSLLAGRW